MKKFQKIVLIIIGIVFLIFVLLIGIGLFVDVEYDDHIENGRYTYCLLYTSNIGIHILDNLRTTLNIFLQ